MSEFDLIQVAQVRHQDMLTGRFSEPPSFSQYVLLPMNAYRLGNLLDAVGQAQDNGDWYGEFCNIVHDAMQKVGVTELTSNRGNKFTLGDVMSRNIRR